MTWDEFKKIVDDEIAAAGFTGTLPVAAIKFSASGRDGLDIAVTEPNRGPEAALQVWNV